MINIKIKKLKETAIIPKYAHEGDAGVDLYSTEDYILNPGERVLVSTGIAISIPEGYEAQVRPKSGLALKHGISIVNTPGTIDCKYRGEIGIITINLGKEDYKIEKGHKIAQMVFNKIEEADFEEVKELDNTKRGEGGFGSTGHK
ncbi:MAG: dUTP diphosphatase [Nanoarchaeota archaeon]|nr:dUTP diphosphatase [Nanoarchaeota archaeon]MBU1004733.1 dUTP diphosphatase [Nanoarchaeota archaeon]MBU1945336.1 dUTP diphosphatase [Nanoarchaeota archaeon]